MYPHVLLDTEKQRKKNNMQKESIPYQDFEKVDIRIGYIQEVIAPDWSEKLLQLTVFFGDEIGVKTIFSGIKAWYQPEELVNKKGMFVVNLAERKMGKGVSQGMMLMADELDRPVPLFVPDTIQVGSVVR